MLPFVFYFSNAKDSRNHNPFDRAIVFISSPVQWLVVNAVDGITGLWHDYIALVRVEEENVELRARVSTLEAQLSARIEQALENERLQLLLQLRDRSAAVVPISARIIATSPTPLFRSVRIDRGSDDGVQVGAAVVSHQGVVGRVAAVTGGWANVMLLVDANSSTDVLVQRTRARARVRGLGGDRELGVKVEYLARAQNIEPGDILITSGVGTVFPKGLRIGTVISVKRGAFGLYQEAIVEPSVDFRRLEEVMVIRRGWPQGTNYELEEEPDPSGREESRPNRHQVPMANPAQKPRPSPARGTGPNRSARPNRGSDIAAVGNEEASDVQGSGSGSAVRQPEPRPTPAPVGGSVETSPPEPATGAADGESG